MAIAIKPIPVLTEELASLPFTCGDSDAEYQC